MPLLRSLIWRPLWVPSGIVTFARPPSQRRYLDRPAKRGRYERNGRAAVQIVPVALEDRMRVRWRGKCRDRLAGPPFRPAWPSPVRRMRVPSSTPGGISTESVRSFCTCPCAAAGLAGFAHDAAFALAFGQVRSIVKKPCCARTLPAPEQVEQASGAVPGFGAAAAAGLAGDGCGDADFRILRRRNASSSVISRL